MTKVITYETPGVEIVEFRDKPEGPPQKVIKFKDWKGDPKKLRKEAEKIAPPSEKAVRVHRAKGEE